MQYQLIAAELRSMYEIDQKLRIEAMETGVRLENQEDVDRRHTRRLKEIVAQIGWPTVSRVGKEGANDAWLLVQHASNDVNFQRECLELMKAAAPGEVGLSHVAYLEDRVLLAEGKKQIYGTQFETDEFGELQMRPTEDLEHVDERRAAIGLWSVTENIEAMKNRPKP